MLTAYTMRMAQLLDPHCEMLLVGDSLGQVIYGLPSTVPVTLEMMCAHGAAVVRGSWHALVAVDMPFGSYEGSPEPGIRKRVAGDEGNRLRGGQAGGRRGDGRDDRLPHPSRHPGDRPCRPDPAGGQRAWRLWRARQERRRGEEDIGRRQGGGRRRRLLHRRRRGDGGDRRRGDRGGRRADHRYRRVARMRRAGAGDRGHARPVRAHAAVRETLRRHGKRDRRGGRRPMPTEVRSRAFPTEDQTYRPKR